MKKYKRFLSSFLLVFFISFNICSVGFCATPVDTFSISNIGSLFVKGVGLVANDYNIGKEYLKNLFDVSSDSELENSINDHLTKTVNDSTNEVTYVIDDTLRDYLNQSSDYYKNSVGWKYVYTYDIKDFYSKFNDKKDYDFFVDLVNGSKLVSSVFPRNSLENRVLYVPDFCVSITQSEFSASRPDCNMYDDDWTNTDVIGVTKYIDGNFIFYSDIKYDDVPIYLTFRTDPNNAPNMTYSNYAVSDGVYQIIMFDTVTALKQHTLGVPPSYFQIDPTNLPQLTTSNISSYNSSYSNLVNDSSIKDSNNYYDYSQVTNIVNNYITNNGGSDNDNDNDNPSFDWGFLGSIGEFIGGLISALGKAISGILEGLSSLLESLITDIPTLFNDFLGALLGWLPPEITALIGLSIGAMIIIGIIKLIRG